MLFPSKECTYLQRVHQILHQEETPQLLKSAVNMSQRNITIFINKFFGHRHIGIQTRSEIDKNRGRSVYGNFPKVLFRVLFIQNILSSMCLSCVAWTFFFCVLPCAAAHHTMLHKNANCPIFFQHIPTQLSFYL